MNNFNVSKEKVNRLFAIVSLLYVVILILNAGYVSRTFTFPYMFIFGEISYLIYALIVNNSIYTLIKGKMLKIKKFKIILGICLLVVGFCLLSNVFVAKRYNSLSANNTLNVRMLCDIFFSKNDGNFFPTFNSLGGYYFDGILIIGDSLPLGGGIIGYSLFSIFEKVFTALPLTVSIIVITAALSLLVWSFVDYFQTTDLMEKIKERNKNKVVKNKNYIKDAANISDAVRIETPKKEVGTQVSFSSEDFLNSQFTMSNNKEDKFAPVTFGDEIIVSVINNDEETVSNNDSLIEETPLFEETNHNVQEDMFDKDEFIETAEDFIPYTKEERSRKPTNKPSKIVWKAPDLDLLEVYSVEEENNTNIQEAEKNKAIINQTLIDFRIGAEVKNYVIGPSFTRFELMYEPNATVKSVGNIIQDMSVRLSGLPLRFEAVVSGLSGSSLELPNAVNTIVSFKEVLEQLPSAKTHPLAIGFGKNVSGEVKYADFNKFPHMLLAGTTGSGKSILLHSIITTLIMRNSPDNLRLAIVDPKKVEMSRYKDIPHLLCPIVNEPKDAKNLLSKLVNEMNNRYAMFEAAEGCTSLDEYNEYAQEYGEKKLPYIIVILDEYGDLVESCKDIANPVILIGQKARACGIHLLIATQRPDASILTGTIKSNLPLHVALSVSTFTDSNVIIGQGGAEKLLGHGDMLVQSTLFNRDGGLIRLQGCLIQKIEISRVVHYLKDNYTQEFDERFLNLEKSTDEISDDLSGNELDDFRSEEEKYEYENIKERVKAYEYMSQSKLRADMRIGNNKARRFFVLLQKEGVVSYEEIANKGALVLTHSTNNADVGKNLVNNLEVTDAQNPDYDPFN